MSAQPVSIPAVSAESVSALSRPRDEKTANNDISQNAKLFIFVNLECLAVMRNLIIVNWQLAAN